MSRLYKILFILLMIQLSSCSIHKYQHNTISETRIYQGILEEHNYPCSVPGPKLKKMYVYLPKSYYQTNAHYPVVYLLHGANGNETSWIMKGNILKNIDSLIINREINECIYVFPNMNHYNNDYDYGNSREKGSIEAFWGLDGSVEYSFANDVITYIDKNFRTIPFKRYRAIAGLSLGGLQTLYISSNNCDSFNYVGLFSPLIYPPFRIGPYTSVYKDLENKLKAQFRTPPSIYWIMVGVDDAYFNSAYFYSKLLSDKKHRHILHISDGGHTWDNWENYSIMFLKSLWDFLPQETQ